MPRLEVEAIAGRPAVIDTVRKVTRRKAKVAARRAVSGAKERSPQQDDGSPRAEKKTGISSPDMLRASSTEIASDEQFLNTVRDKVLERLNLGEMELKIADGLRAVELKSRICGGTDYQGILRELLEEIRREALAKLAI